MPLNDRLIDEMKLAAKAKDIFGLIICFGLNTSSWGEVFKPKQRFLSDLFVNSCHFLFLIFVCLDYIPDRHLKGF